MTAFPIRVTMLDAVGIGALNVDLIFSVPRLNIAGRDFTPGAEVFGTVEEFSSVLRELRSKGKLMSKSGGGSAANTMAAMAGMGIEVGMLGVVGSDEEGEFLLREMTGVDLSRIRKSGGTGECISLVSKEDRSLLVLPNANDHFVFDSEDVEYLNDSKIVHLTSFVGDSGLEAQKRIAKEIDGRFMLSLDPGVIYARKGLRAVRQLLKRCDIIFPNEREVEMLTGLDCVEGSRQLLELGPEVVVCTMGGEGSMIVTDTQETVIRARPAKVVDKTGAGDVYAAGFLTGVLRNWPLRRCGDFASFLAARSISSYGRGGYPDRRSVERYLEELR